MMAWTKAEMFSEVFTIARRKEDDRGEKDKLINPDIGCKRVHRHLFVHIFTKMSLRNVMGVLGGLFWKDQFIYESI